MADLSHWDFADEFSGMDAAALILGLEASESETEVRRVHVVCNRMIQDYIWLLNWFEEYTKIAFSSIKPQKGASSEWLGKEEKDWFNWLMREKYSQCSGGLESVRMKQAAKSASVLSEGSLGTFSMLTRTFNDEKMNFNLQKFDRIEIIRWLTATGMKSVYQFDRSKDSTAPTAIAQTDPDIDPADLPIELDAANMAYRAVLNGHGEKTDTFKNRLIDYLQKNFKDMTAEAVQRIATVANPDKSAGRKKRDKE